VSVSSRLPPDSADHAASTYKNQSGAADDGFGRDDDEGLLPSRPDRGRAITQKSLSKEVEARAKMVDAQRDEVLTAKQDLKKETSPPAKEANQHAEEEPYETKHDEDLITER